MTVIFVTRDQGKSCPCITLKRNEDTTNDSGGDGDGRGKIWKLLGKSGSSGGSGLNLYYLVIGYC